MVSPSTHRVNLEITCDQLLEAEAALAIYSATQLLFPFASQFFLLIYCKPLQLNLNLTTTGRKNCELFLLYHGPGAAVSLPLARLGTPRLKEMLGSPGLLSNPAFGISAACKLPAAQAGGTGAAAPRAPLPRLAAQRWLRWRNATLNGESVNKT